MKPKTREQKTADAFYQKPIVYKDITFNVLSVARMGLLTKVQSAFMVGGDRAKAMADILFATSCTINELLDSANNETFDLEAYKFMDQFTFGELTELESIVLKITEGIFASIVEEIPDGDSDDDSKKK